MNSAIKKLITLLLKLGLKKNDNIYLSINFFSLALSLINKKNSINKNSINKNFITALRNIIGEKGNIFVPTYTFTFKSYKNNFIYDINKTRSKIGEFPNFFLKLKNIKRSKDPIVSITGIGPKVGKILGKYPSRSYGPGTFWERFNKLKNSKILNVALGPYWFPFVHQAEFEAKVKYRKNTVFYGIIKNKKKLKHTKWIYFARNLDENKDIDTEQIGRIINKKKIILKQNLGRTVIYMYDLKTVFNEFVKILKENNKILLS